MAVAEVLAQALDLVAACHGAYADSDSTARRQCNQAFFKNWVRAGSIAGDEREVPFDDLTDPGFAERLRSKRSPSAQAPFSGPWFSREASSRGGRTRTGDLMLPKHARYQAAPRPATRPNVRVATAAGHP